MTENYFYIEPKKANELLLQIKNMTPSKNGIDRHAYLVDDYAILTTNRLKLRNITIRDDNLIYFNELIKTLMDLHLQGVSVIPILGYCFEPNSENGKGYIFQRRAKGSELYDDAVMKKYYSWAQNNSQSNYLSSDVDAHNYILKRTSYISKIPQKHFNKFVSDIIVLCDNDILIDFNGKSSFFYDENEGFQFIDIDSHTDYKYGLNAQKHDSRKIAVIGGFTPCHLSSDTKIFSHLALDPKAISEICADDLIQLSYHNKLIFKKCKLALLNNGIAESKYTDILQKIKIFNYLSPFINL